MLCRLFYLTIKQFGTFDEPFEVVAYLYTPDSGRCACVDEVAHFQKKVPTDVRNDFVDAEN